MTKSIRAVSGQRRRKRKGSPARKYRACLALAFAMSACGGSENNPKTADDATESDFEPTRRGRGMSASSEIGALDEAAVTGAFSGSLAGLQRCVDAGAERVEFIGGEIAFFLKIDQEGRVSHAHAERTTLGDRATERCMLDVLRKQSWPRPQGGDLGLARNSFDFDMQRDVRPPTMWESDQVSSAIDDLRSQITECTSRTSGEFIATMYVDTEGNALSVGIAPSDESGEDAADCLARVLKDARYPSPGSWPAKVTFHL